MDQQFLHGMTRAISRRGCLQLGVGGLFGGTLVGALKATAQAAGEPAPLKRQVKSVILFWLDGGPSHYESFDPKPDAPAEIRGEFGEINTSLPGVLYSQYMVGTATIAHKTALVRSIRHDQGNHGAGNHYLMTGAPPRIPVGCGAFVSFHPSMGSVAAHQLGPASGLPGYVTMPDMSRSGGPNFLGQKYGPFEISDDPNSGAFRVRDVALPDGLANGRYLERGGLRNEIDKLLRINDARAGDPALALDEFYHQGQKLITSTDAQAAFDIHSEPAAIREMYGRNVWGQRTLLARRLVEAGVPFITLVAGSSSWDHHGKIFDACKRMLPPIDTAFTALVNDLEQRGMLDSTLVVCLGEFGRTPKINPGAGRDHWSNAMSVLLAGGGIRGGQVIGATDRAGYAPIDRPLSPENFVSTIYAKLGIDPNKILHTPEGRPVHLVSDPTPIKELMG